MVFLNPKSIEKIKASTYSNSYIMTKSLDRWEIASVRLTRFYQTNLRPKR